MSNATVMRQKKDIKGCISVNGTILFKGRSDGFARVTTEIIKSFTQKGDYFKVFSSYGIVNIEDTIKVSKILARADFLGNMTKLIWHQIVLPQIIKKRKDIYLYYSPTHDGMLNPPCQQVITLYDLIPLLFPKDSPRYYYYYRFIVPKLIKTSFYTVVGSYATERDIETLIKAGGKTKVIYPGYNKLVFYPRDNISITRVKEKYDLRNYILFVGEIRPYKNVKKLIEAFDLIDNKTYTLVIVGRLSKLSKDIPASLEKSKSKENIKMLGYVPDEELSALYSGATAFVFPSLYEGFGLPPLEAMACGCPVIVSNTSSLPEVCGDAGHYFNPYKAESIVNAVQFVVDNSNVRTRMVEKGILQAAKFSYENTVRELMELFKQAAVE